MNQKIRYRLVFNYSGKLNSDGRAPVAVEARQGAKKVYFSSNVLIYPDQWSKGSVINHENSAKVTVYLHRWMHSIEEVELDVLLRGGSMTLSQLKEAFKSGIRANATLSEFTDAVIGGDSSRCENTKRSYTYLINDMEKEYGRLLVSDITYDFIVRYRENMRKKKLSENTIKGRLKALRCLMEQARLRDLVEKNPFDNITIGNMSARVEYLNKNEVGKIERLKLEGKEEKVKDLFLLSCYTGLRFSDLASLEEAEIRNGIMRKKMKKTHHYVNIPISTLFWGKGKEIIDKYPDITDLSHCCCNTTFNKMIKDIGAKAGIKKNMHCHLGRKTCSNMLSEMGMGIEDISTILGHTETKVTRKHYLFNDSERIQKTVKKLFK